MKKKRYLFIKAAVGIAACCSLLPVFPAVADSEVKFHGTLLVVECRLNDGKKQSVDFGNAVGIHRIDGKRYEQPVPFHLECENYSGGKMPPMTLTLEGTPVSFNKAAVATNVKGLGIELRRNGEAQPLNQAVELDSSAQPVLTAVPVADPSFKLNASPFTASIKLSVEVP